MGGEEIINERGFADLIGMFYEPENRQDRIA
jgi:hypothetical protein